LKTKISFLYIELIRLQKYSHKLLIAIILVLFKLYQNVLSPFIGNSCRFYPSCSTYAIDAYKSFGILTGTSLTIKRLVKCHPYHPGGLDQLPKKNDYPINLMDKGA